MNAFNGMRSKIEVHESTFYFYDVLLCIMSYIICSCSVDLILDIFLVVLLGKHFKYVVWVKTIVILVFIFNRFRCSRIILVT